MAHELKPVMPTAVGVLPERRWTNPKGVTNQTKNVMLVRDTHLLFAALGWGELHVLTHPHGNKEGLLFSSFFFFSDDIYI